MQKLNILNKGISLIEVVISMGLLIMIIGLLPMSSLIQQSNQYSMNKTYSTNIALALSEQLLTFDFDDLGTDTFSACVDADGKAFYSSSDGACKEDPLNTTGYTELEGDGESAYIFTRYSVVCDNTLNLPGGFPDPCAIPDANLTGGPVPDLLSCTASDYDAYTKEIRIMVAHRDRNGRCFTSSLESTKVSTN